MKQQISWTEYKEICITDKNIPVQYLDKGTWYYIFAVDDTIAYALEMSKSDPRNADQIDFEDNYKATANQPIHPSDLDGRMYTRSGSRPLNKTTYFTMIGDGDGTIGDGNTLDWDFSNSDYEIAAPSGYKRKRKEIHFIDDMNVKEGAVYFHGAPKGCYADFYVVCPSGQYYLKNDGTPALSTGDTVIDHFLSHHFMCGDCPMGDELNTEEASMEIPSIYKYWLEVTTPDTDTVSHGYLSMEVYRARTVIL